MTGRFFRQDISWEAYAERLPTLIPPPGFAPPEPTYNAAPRSWQPVLRIAPERSHVELAPLEWGLIPGWWTKHISELKHRPFNTRAEDAPYRAFTRGAWRHHRCLIPVHGYYTWAGEAGAKIPFAVGMHNKDWFCLAGLWDVALIEGSEIHGFTVLTTAPNDVVAGIDTRMPVIIPPDRYMDWLDPLAGKGEALMRSYPASDMTAWPVGAAVGNVRNNGPDLIAGV